MQTRTFQARQIKEALALVRRELGPNAIIVETKRVSGRTLGLLGGTFIQVTASPGEDEEPRTGSPDPSPVTSTAAPPSAFEPVGRESPSTPTGREDPSPLWARQRADRAQRNVTPKRPVRDLIAESPRAAVSAATGMGQVRPHAALRRRLLAAMVPRDLCEAWLSQLPDLGPSATSRANEEAHLRALLHRMLGDAAPLCAPGSRVAALVGSTGVGKTTTIAKFAARAHLIEQKKVAIVSLDDQRIGSTTQLRAYANLLDVPLSTATSAGGLARALAEVRDADLVLVDTAGISPGKPDDFKTLARRLARAGEPVTTHLCIAASTRIEELDRMLHLYSATEPQAILPTKVDEAVAVGTVLAARVRSGAPLSFATTGQQVPEDITIATPRFIVDLLLGGAQA